MKYLFIIYLLIFLAVGMGGCSSKKKEELQQDQKEAFESAKGALSDRLDKIIHDLPPPSELPLLLKSTGIDYIPDIINPLDNLDRYMISNSKAALNLGIYATDIGYLASHDQLQGALEYMGACQKIADDIGISTAFGEDLIDRFQENISRPDSLVTIINEGIKRAEERLEDLDELTMAALTLSGSFIEGIYIATKLIERHGGENASNAQKELIVKPLVDIISEQNLALLNLISMLKSTERNAHTIQLIEQMNVLRFQYDDFTSYVETQEYENKTLDMESDAIKDLLDEIKAIRAEIVSIAA